MKFSINIFNFFILLIITISSCKDDSNSDNDIVFNKEKIMSDEEFEGIEILFNENKFDDTNAVSLLKEINICSDANIDKNNKIKVSCSPENFKFFHLKEDLPIQDGFILLVKANTGGISLRRVLIFERENGTLIKTNGFIANIIGKRKNINKYDDLLLRFIDKIDGDDYFYNCIFVWENGKYEFKTVEIISQPAANFNRRIKENLKDSVSQEIYKILINNEMIF
jgi:hypothetical protein